MRLTNAGSDGARWTPDRTVKVLARYPHPQMHYDRRSRPLGYDVIDVLEGSRTMVATIPEATEVAAVLVAAHPTLDWSDWIRDQNDDPDPRKPARTLYCTATSPTAGLVEAWADLVQSREHPGMWAVGYTMPEYRAYWLCSIRHIPHRLAFVRAHAAWRTLNRGEPLE